MSGTQPVRDLLNAELDSLESRRQAIFTALAALDAACDHANYTVEDWGGWGMGDPRYNGSARCDECQELIGYTRNGELATT